MTAQMNDVFRYHGEDYALAGISKGVLINPIDFGLNPFMASTACWRGYVATFAISDSLLILDTLAVNHQVNKTTDVQTGGPPINGINPTTPKDSFRSFNNLYQNLNYFIDYTGGLLLGRDFIRDLYVHMGFHPAWKYESVIELIFEKGIVSGEFDRSDKMTRLRQEILKIPDANKSGQMPTNAEIDEFIHRSFDRTYGGGN